MFFEVNSATHLSVCGVKGVGKVGLTVPVLSLLSPP